MENPVIYIILNGELGMSAGKAAAQAVHAAMLLEGNYPGLFIASYERTVVVLEARDTDTIRNLHEYLRGANIYSSYYIDERGEGSRDTRDLFNITALAVEPIEADDVDKRNIFSDLSLFGRKKKKWYKK